LLLDLVEVTISLVAAKLTGLGSSLITFQPVTAHRLLSRAAFAAESSSCA
jgi:hypothetical protein